MLHELSQTMKFMVSSKRMVNYWWNL